MSRSQYSAKSIGGIELLATLTVALAIRPGLALADQAQSLAVSETDIPAASELQQVVVTAQRRSENAQAVPIAVTTASGSQLQSMGVTSSLQLPTIAPSLQIQTAVGMETHIRGVGTISDGPGVENPVALYVDGVYYGAQVMGELSFDDVAQISVLNGPQGTLFGRNATGGVIQITTRDPGREREFEVSEDLDDYLTSRTDLYATDAVSANSAANIWVSYAAQRKGWGTNFATGRDDVHKINHDFETRGKWLISPSDKTSIKLELDWMDRFDNNSLNIVPLPGTERYTAVPGYQSSTNPWDTDITPTATNQIQSGGGSITFDTELPFAHLRSISAYRAFNYVGHFSPTASPIPGEDVIVNDPGEQVTQELQLLSPKSSIINWVVGMFYYYDNERTTPTSLDLLPPFLAPADTLILVNTRTITNSAAAYGQMTAPVPWVTNTRLTLGLRDTYDHRAFRGSESVADFAVPLPPVAPTLETDRPTWRVALDHDFSKAVMGYVSYNRGFKSGGYNGFDPTNPPYRPETVDAYEAGMKSELFNHRLRLNASLFDEDYENIQVTRYTSTAVIYNGAKARIMGGELSAQARVGSFLVGAAVDGLRTRFNSFNEASCSTPNSPLPSITQFSCSATGHQLPYSPKFTGNLTLDYFQSVSWGRLDYNITDYHNSGYFFEPDNRLRQSSYDTLNASATLTAADDRFSIKIYATNLLDRAVLSFAATDLGYNAVYGNPPRLAGVKVTYRF